MFKKVEEIAEESDYYEEEFPEKVIPVRPGRYCSPRRPTHFEPSCIASNGIFLCDEQYLPGPRFRAK